MNTGSTQSPGFQLVPVVCARGVSGSVCLPKEFLPFEAHTEQKKWLHYATKEVKNMAGYAVKHSKYCCTDKRLFQSPF